ncbi:uncharacterized protein J3D65DRAFT_581836 [Phyllosticta citribraziliensis]|uniref:Prolyl 4-hydroxylase alpha subunit Fe(2+) 2OG dioxygenase domain-containing protein n=1 Tax=Phyllosticta citribraziliensis TaxID=989973 RepID=A0ABR1MCK7_9PEZI
MDEDLAALSSPRSDGSLRLVSEDPSDYPTLRGELAAELDGIDCAGTFASFTSLDVDPDFVDPKIEVKNVGIINTPLVPEDVQKLTNACRPSPFGKGSQTIVDPAVRSSWEMDAADFLITNPFWPTFMDKTLKTVQMVLGIDPELRIEAHLYKMLLYGKGAHFKPHQDSEKERDMFGTLVICLPAPHRGGDVIAQLGDQKRIFRTSECYKSCLFWYSDVQHEITEITAGHRWVLTYNLIRPASASMSSLRHEYPLLKRTLGSWRQACNREDFWRKQWFVYVLEHKYTQSSLGLDKLKGKDLAQARALQDHCEAPGFCVFLANIAEMRYGGADDEPVRNRNGARKRRYHRIIDICETEIRLTRVVDLAGKEVAGNVWLGPDEEPDTLLKRGSLSAGDPDDAEFTPYTGNEGCDATHWYRHTAIVFMPWEQVPKFLTSTLAHDQSWKYDQDHTYLFNLEETVGFLLNELQKQPDRPIVREALENFSRIYMLQQRPQKYLIDWEDFRGETDINTMLRAAVKCDNPKIFEIVSEGLSHGVLPSFALGALSGWLFERGFAFLEHSLSHFVSLHPSIHQVFKLCRGILRPHEAGFEERKRKCQESGFCSWASGRLSEAISRSSDVDSEDGRVLAEILYLSDDTKGALPSVTDVVERNISNTEFAMSFLGGIVEQVELIPHRFPAETASQIYRHIAALCIQHLDLRAAKQKPRKPEPLAGRKRSMIFPSKSPTPDPWEVTPAVSPTLINCMFDFLHEKLHDEKLVDELFNKFQSEAKRTNVDFYPQPMMNFLRHVGGRWESLGVERIRPLFSNVIECYLMQGVGREYKEPNWSRPPLGCPCGGCFCKATDRFLVDPNKTGTKLKLIHSARRHLREKLAGRQALYMRDDHTRSNPATLCIEKLPDSEHHEADRLKRRHQKFDDQMKSLNDVVPLREVLGDRYNYLVKKRALWWAESNAGGR